MSGQIICIGLQTGRHTDRHVWTRFKKDEQEVWDHAIHSSRQVSAPYLGARDEGCCVEHHLFGLVS